ncbi:maltase A1-like [Culicoides brevitarsis]|uniref:maltase A1-like n=1 Tax=Culicoides brevitarsis TaxID=469753 RepID=UPI00307C869D
MSFTIIFYVFLSVFFISASSREWWESANYYQIYPKSYADADNDGIGDIAGIKSKIPYLKELGMDAIWLSPIFNSSWKDGGYDISNFTMIDPLFGSMQDFDDLLATCKANGIRFILDFVPNHSSNECEWFLKSERREIGYEDFYVWHPGKENPDGGRNLEPSNWRSGFRGSAWQWSEVRGEYYYHDFGVAQPDLNYRSAAVVQAMKDVLRFWLDKGVDGFRVDAVQHLFEIDVGPDGNYPDEALSGNCQDDPDSYCYTNHLYNQNQPETYDMVQQWRELLDSYTDSPRIMLTEAYTTLDNLMLYYGTSSRKGSHIPFNFEVLQTINVNSTAKQLKIVSENYMNHIPAGLKPNWVLGNHDQRRIATRLGENRTDLYNIYLQTMPGHAITYQGEEIGMEDVYISWAETQDPAACNTNPEIFDQVSRDRARTPMQWNSSVNAGFNAGAKTWLPVGTNYKEVNVAKQNADERSHHKIFRKLVQLHKKSAFRDGIYEGGSNLDENIYTYIRSDDKETYLVALNFAKIEKVVNFSTNFRDLKPDGQVVVASLSSILQEKASIKTHENVVLSAESGIVVKINAAPCIFLSILTLLAAIFVHFINNL